MAKRNIDDLFDDLEDFIGSCKQQKLSSNRIIVPRDELLNQIREIQMKIPSEVEHSNKVMENRDMILSEARRKADAIVAEANNEAMRRVNDTEIMNMATEQARALIEQAQMKAMEIENQANEEANFLRYSALNYTNNVMTDLAGFTTQLLEEEKQKYEILLQTLTDEYDTIETNRQQIVAQLQSSEAPKGDGSNNITRKEMSDVERMHRETRAMNSARRAKESVEQRQAETIKPEIKVKSISEPSVPRQTVAVQTPEPQYAELQPEYVSQPQPQVQVREERTTPDVMKEQAPPAYLNYQDSLPIDDELDELDEIFLDQ